LRKEVNKCRSRKTVGGIQSLNMTKDSQALHRKGHARRGKKKAEKGGLKYKRLGLLTWCSIVNGEGRGRRGDYTVRMRGKKESKA